MTSIRDEIENEVRTARRCLRAWCRRTCLEELTCMQVEAADRRSATMAFTWAGARALRRTHLGRFMKLRSDTAWLEGTLFEIDHPGQPGQYLPFVVFIAEFVCDVFYLQFPNGSNPPMRPA